MELQWQFIRGMWIVGALLFAAFCGLLLGATGNAVLVMVLFAPVVWLVLLPYHARIVIVFATCLFNSAFIVPFVSGRPFLWEAFGVLGWSGLVVTLALREQTTGAAWRFQRNWLLFTGLVSFCAVLFVTMYFRGVGLKAFGSSQIGGRIYFQQLVTSVFPVLFATICPDKKTLMRLFQIQCALALSFVVADVIFAYGNGATFQLLLFLELPNDGLNFEQQAMSGGIRRFQSLAFTAMGFLSILWMRNSIFDYFTRKGIWLWPVTLAIFVCGLLSGHRYMVYFTVITFFTIAWCQRFFSVGRTLISGILVCVVYLFLLGFSRELPLSTQRAISFIPGIDVDPIAAYDGKTTMDGRRMVRNAGWEESKKYRWLGRGFSKWKLDDRYYPDQTYMWVDWGIFYNGTVGTLVNLGIPGAAALVLFLTGGSICSVRIVRYARSHRTHDNFTRMACVVAGGWFANTFSFVVLHGDSEFTLRTFAMPAAMLLVCDYWLQKQKSAEAVMAGDAVPQVNRVIPFRPRMDGPVPSPA